MLDTLFNLIGITVSDYHFNDDLLLVLASLFVLFCLGYVFNFFQCLMERCTSKR